MQISIDKTAQLLYDYGMNNLDFLKNIKINSCGISDCGADWRWDTGESGFRDFDFWLVVRGKGRMRANLSSVEVKRGSCLILFPNTHYVGEHSKENQLMTMNVHFSAPEWHSEPCTESGLPFVFHDISDISYMIDMLYRVIRLYNADKAELAETVFRSALVEYFSQNSITPENEYSADKPALIQKICDAINISPARAPTLSAFAAEYGYSADYLGRIFSKSVGISFSEYVANARVNKAKFLLSSTSMSLDEIAESLGYYDPCHFSRQFKRITGTSPGKYKKNT